MKRGHKNDEETLRRAMQNMIEEELAIKAEVKDHLKQEDKSAYQKRIGGKTNLAY